MSYVLALCLLVADPTAAAPAISASAEAPRDLSPPLAVAAALVPGALVHGAGHYVAGEPETGRRLLLAEGVGLGLLVGGLAGLAVTGASRRMISPLILTATAGAGLFGTSFLADVYGVLARGRQTGEAPRLAPPLDARAGALLVRDPTGPGAAFFGPSLGLRHGRLGVGGRALWAADEIRQARYEAAVSWRAVGPRPGHPARDGSSLDVVLAGVHHRYGPEATALGPIGFALSQAELRLDGRFDLARFAPTLTGSFVDGGAGYALALHRDRPSGAREGHEGLLARFGFGVWLGAPERRFGEVSLFYESRRDDFAAGSKTPGLGSGALGHVGLSALLLSRSGLGVAAEARAGAAHVLGLSLVYRPWGRS